MSGSGDVVIRASMTIDFLVDRAELSEAEDAETLLRDQFEREFDAHGIDNFIWRELPDDGEPDPFAELREAIGEAEQALRVCRAPIETPLSRGRRLVWRKLAQSGTWRLVVTHPVDDSIVSVTDDSAAYAYTCLADCSIAIRVEAAHVLDELFEKAQRADAEQQKRVLDAAEYIRHSTEIFKRSR